MLDNNNYWDHAFPSNLLKSVKVTLNVDPIEGLLEQPFDAVIDTLIESTACEVASHIEGCKFGYVNNCNVFFIIDNSSLCNSKVNELTSKFTSAFILNTTAFLLDYQDRISEMSDKLSDEDLETLNKRVSNLWKMLDTHVYFTTDVCFLSDMQVEEMLYIVRADGYHAAVKKAFVHEGYIDEGHSSTEIEETLIADGKSIPELVPERNRLGMFIIETEDGWVATLDTNGGDDEC